MIMLGIYAVFVDGEPFAVYLSKALAELRAGRLRTAYIEAGIFDSTIIVRELSTEIEE